uniref:Methyltransferase type 11 domain-containing protein n=1 Tax=Marmota marmota marmota TaxID=9994 RepID=A0A8C6EZ12_MARMA
MWNQISKKWFPYYMMKFSATYNGQMAGKKQELFSKLQDFAGPSGKLSLLESIAENRHLQFERFLVAPGENMHQVADSSVDVVVCTTVLCSVENQEQMLREVCRVLRPGGAFFFIEHVADEHSTWNYCWQVVEPAWYLVFDGCYLTRESWKALERASFSKLKLQHIQPPLSCKVLRPHVYGYAVK